MEPITETYSSKTSEHPRALKVRTGVRAGIIVMNHNETALKVRTGVKAGFRMMNHNETVL
jgi:hypothetical protein